MNTPLLAVIAALALWLAGCGYLQNPFGDRDASSQPDSARYLVLEVEDLETGLPCRVIDRPDAETRDVLWRARFEQGFCRRKAEETRSLLEERGWACRPQDADERQALAQSSASLSNGTHIAAAWRCVDGLTPIERSTRADPPVPVPAARPATLGESQAASWGNPALREAVERDLAAIGQDVIGSDTAVAAAFGDLDDDAIDDAVVVLTRRAEQGAPHRLLMAYLQNGEAYTLVDVWILKTSDVGADGELALAIEDGAVRLEGCCQDQDAPTVLVLDERKLTYADDR